MNKADFLNQLDICLQKMNDTERKKFINYYEEIISDYVENGVTEEDAVQKIGSPVKIAEELLADYDSVKINLPSSGNKAINLILTIIGFPLWGSVLLTVILLAFSVYVTIWCLPFATGAGCIGIFAASIIGIAGTPFVMSDSVAFGIIQFGVGIASIGISVLLGYATIYLSRRFILVTKKFNAKLTALFKKKVVIR